MKLLLLCTVFATAASAETFSFGVTGGVPFNDVISATTTSNYALLPQSTNFVIGPSFQVNLPLSLRFEVDALYRPYSFSVGQLAGRTPGRYDVSASQWQFPFLAQYRFKLPVVTPFVEGGLSFDHLSNISAAANNISSGPGQLVQQSHAGVVLGGGVDVKLLIFRLSGELRYTHQGSADFRGISNLNQAAFLLGIHF